jgi:hypothetical protein
MAILGSVSLDGMAEILSLSRSKGASVVHLEGPAETGPSADFAHRPERKPSARYWMRGIVLLLIILLILWLIYRTFTGWKPMISWPAGETLPVAGSSTG